MSPEDRMYDTIERTIRGTVRLRFWAAMILLALYLGGIAYVLLFTLVLPARGDEIINPMPGAQPMVPPTIKGLIEQQLGPFKTPVLPMPSYKPPPFKPPFVIKRLKWPHERSA